MRQAFTGLKDPSDASERLRLLLNKELQPVEKLARSVAEQESHAYLGIDTSPAPALDSSIGAALETLTGEPFGSASSASASVIRRRNSRGEIGRCHDLRLLRSHAADSRRIRCLPTGVVEGRIKIDDLLLYSTVCGTGLDVVPVPGDAAPGDLARVIGDVATLAVRLRKPLSARLFVVPGKKAGERVEFADPMLCASKVRPLEG